MSEDDSRKEPEYFTATEMLRREAEMKKRWTVVDDLFVEVTEEMRTRVMFWYNQFKELMADQHNDPTRHPSSDPHFDAKRKHTVWYLSHPLAGDEQFTFEQNMAHVIHIMRICFEEGVMVIAPYHTICLALDDDNPEWRRMGLECDCNMARLMGYMLLTGHKLSSGMNHEAEQSMACKTGGIIRNLIGYNDEELREALKWIKDGGTLESDEQLPAKV